MSLSNSREFYYLHVANDFIHFELYIAFPFEIKRITQCE